MPAIGTGISTVLTEFLPAIGGGVAVDTRITEASNTRITEAGDTRITET